MPEALQYSQKNLIKSNTTHPPNSNAVANTILPPKSNACF